MIAYVRNEPTNYGDGESVLTMLYECYSDSNRMDDEQIRADFRELYAMMNGMTIKEMDKIICCIASTGFYVCTSNGAFLPEFMFFLMISGYVVGGLNQYMKGDNSPSISKDNIENWLYPVPPLEEQRVICAKLQSVFSLIENVEQSLS